MDQIFLPAVGPYITDKPKNIEIRFPFHWIDPKSPIYYPYNLASYALWRDATLPQGGLYFGDSGGYTAVTQPGYSASPTDVIRWQIKNCQKGVIFDLPPYRLGSAIQFTGSASEMWEERLTLTIQNVTRALPIYLDHLKERFDARIGIGGWTSFKWWGVVQGEERDQLEDWHRRISEVYPFDAVGEGWALAPKPSTDLLSCTRYMRFAHDKGIKNVHLLQVTADRTVALVLSLAVISGQFDLVTYDSASALRCAINRSAIMPKGFGQAYIKESRLVAVDEYCESCLKLGTECLCPGNENTVHEMMMRCPCQACQWYREFYPLSNAEYPHVILIHNHLTMVESFRLTWEEVQKDPTRVLKWATGKKYGSVLREWEGQSTPKTQRSRVSLFDRL